ncbi:hypothetical protein F2P81_000387 [Scophthalmus maximus]|uniref:Polyhomeotic-like protein 3 n=1 Tax=Scophthalmus maximus TaxID=52904 RepID=A0A6A4TU69_SCOMX|nr:hypothetical protein F2P81_000387 [Scophthalmus maximus]
MATVSSSSTTCTQAPSASLSLIPSDRQAVQVIQHAIHRPQSMAARYLHQMYAAQQQHLMLRTAALQQHQHTPQLQSLATIQQITLPASPVTAQLVGRTQASNSTSAAANSNSCCSSGYRSIRPPSCHLLLLTYLLSVQRLTTPSTQSQTNSDHQAPSSSSSPSSSSVTSVFASSAQTSIPAATVQPQPPPLVAAPQRRTSFPQVQNQPPPPPPPLVLPRLPQNPPASLQRLSLHSVRPLSVQSGKVLLREQELPVGEALVQMPYQNLPPPQTVAVDLKVHVVRRNEAPPSGQTCKVNRLSSEDRKDECSPSRQRDRTPRPLVVSQQNGAELGESVAAVLQCEYCGSRGYAQTFLRSKRFCSMTCVRRFSVSCTKRITMLRAGRWGHRPMGRRGRPPGRVNGASREYFQTRTRGPCASEHDQRCSPREAEEEDEEEEAQEAEEDEEMEEDEPPVPMKTRLRKQAERQRDREREEQRTPETISVSDGEEDAGRPAQWNVEQVFSFISSLPGGQGVAGEFRSQEIDGQALLLLTEDHLLSTMNLKLGPALKLCAHINSLKDA